MDNLGRSAGTAIASNTNRINEMQEGISSEDSKEEINNSSQ